MNKYEIWYNKLIDKARIRNWKKSNAPCYVEAHHILPKSLGGTNKKHNIVLLTAREHCIAHLLLVRFGDAEQKTKMILALQRFLTSNKTVSSVMYESTRNLWITEHKKRMSGNSYKKGKLETEETKRKKRIAMKGNVGKWERTETHKRNISEHQKNNSAFTLNNPMNDPEKRKLVSESKLGRNRVYREDGSFYMSKVQ